MNTKKYKRSKIEYIIALILIILMAFGGFSILTLYRNNFYDKAFRIYSDGATEPDSNEIEIVSRIIDTIRKNDLAGRIMLVESFYIDGYALVVTELTPERLMYNWFDYREHESGGVLLMASTHDISQPKAYVNEEIQSFDYFSFFYEPENNLLSIEFDFNGFRYVQKIALRNSVGIITEE